LAGENFGLGYLLNSLMMMMRIRMRMMSRGPEVHDDSVATDSTSASFALVVLLVVIVAFVVFVVFVVVGAGVEVDVFVFAFEHASVETGAEMDSFVQACCYVHHWVDANRPHVLMGVEVVDEVVGQQQQLMRRGGQGTGEACPTGKLVVPMADVAGVVDVVDVVDVEVVFHGGLGG
jgi:hypothetical protein